MTNDVHDIQIGRPISNHEGTSLTWKCDSIRIRGPSQRSLHIPNFGQKGTLIKTLSFRSMTCWHTVTKSRSDIAPINAHTLRPVKAHHTPEGTFPPPECPRLGAPTIPRQKSIKDSILISSQGEASTLSHDSRVPAKSCLVPFTRSIPYRNSTKHRYLKWCCDRQYLSYLCSGMSFLVNTRLSWPLIPYLDFENRTILRRGKIGISSIREGKLSKSLSSPGSFWLMIDCIRLLNTSTSMTR